MTDPKITMDSNPYYERNRLVRYFDNLHPYNGKVRHLLVRDGEWLICYTCDGYPHIHAPSLPKPPLTPMEASLSRFD